MTRILFVSGTVPPDPCGVGHYTLKLAQSLAAISRAQVGILTGCNGSAFEQGSGVAVFPLLDTWTLRHSKQALSFLRSWKPEVVHVQYPTQGYGKGMLPYILPLAARVLGIRSVQTWHEGYARHDALRLFFQLTAASRKIVVRSNYVDLIHPWLRWIIRRYRLDFIPNGSAIPRATCSREELVRERNQLLKGKTRLIVFFGFLYPDKGVEHIFEVADPMTDHIVVAGPAEKDSSYLQKLRLLAATPKWQGSVTFSGFLTPTQAAILLATADAVILPFRRGGGYWNTSIHSAVLNGAFVITTSVDRRGYDADSNVFYARPDAISDMRSALAMHGGCRRSFELSPMAETDEWAEIASSHLRIYHDMLERP